MMYSFGSYQDASQAWQFDPTTVNTQLRDGNWDWFTQSQRWHGIGGTGTGNAPPSPSTLSNSLYLTSAPAFFLSNSYGANTWPWVNPVNGTVYTLPAKARFDAGTPNIL
jgi:hypothetical protein